MNLKPNFFEKRKHPRVDTSRANRCNIKVFGVAAKPVIGKVINISLGGVAFTSHYQNIAKTVKRAGVKVEIQLPNGRSVDADTTLLRVRPQPESDDCICVLRLTDLKGQSSSKLQKFISF